MPLTHRDHAQGVVFVTGHAQRTARRAADWRRWPPPPRDARLTLVIYMGVDAARRASRHELLHGLPAHTPVGDRAARQPAARSATAITTLGAAGAPTSRAQGFASPAVIVVGDVLRGVAAMDLRRTSAPPERRLGA